MASLPFGATRPVHTAPFYETNSIEALSLSLSLSCLCSALSKYLNLIIKSPKGSDGDYKEGTHHTKLNSHTHRLNYRSFLSPARYKVESIEPRLESERMHKWKQLKLKSAAMEEIRNWQFS